MKPLVSIIIPVYNGENYLIDAVDSALSQTYKNIEIIVVNDGSTDNTDKICKSYGNKIKYILKENGGVSSALNVGIKQMNGEYFSWLSHDDLYFSNKIATQIDFINKNKLKNAIVYSDYICINSKGKSYTKPIVLNHQELITKPKYSLLRGNINGITLLIPKKVFEDCGYFNEELRCTQDYDMWLRIIKKGYNFIHINKVLSKTRIHAQQDTQKNPLVVTEGEKLWRKIIESVSDKEKKELEGSAYNYYYEMAKFLSTTPYEINFNFCIKKCEELNYNQYRGNPLLFNRTIKFNKIQKLLFYLKNQGLINTIKIIVNRIFRRK